MKQLLIILACTMLTSAIGNGQTLQWTEMPGPWAAEDISDMARGYIPNPSGTPEHVTYAVNRAGGYLAKWTSGAGGWQTVLRTAQGEMFAVACVENNPDVVYVGIRGVGIKKSVDGGRTWLDASNRLGNTDINRLKISPHDRQFVLAGMRRGDGSSNVLWETRDGGGSWELNAGFQHIRITITDIVFHSTRERMIFVSGNEGDAEQIGVYFSENGGQVWRRIVEGMRDRAIGAIEFDAVREDENYVYAGSEWWGDFYVLRVEEGNQWTLRHVFENVTITDLDVARSEHYNEVVIAGKPASTIESCRPILRSSTDQGYNWRDESAGIADAQINVVRTNPVAAADEWYHVGTSTAFYRLPFFGMQFEERNQFLSKLPLGAAGGAGTRMVAVVRDAPRGAIAGSTDGGSNWRIEYVENGGLLGMDAVVLGTEPLTALVAARGVPCGSVNPRTALIYRNAGEGWTPTLLSVNGSGIVFALASDPLTPSIVYASGQNDYLGPLIAKSTDAGASWHFVTGGLPSSGSVRGFAIDMRSNTGRCDTLYAAIHGAGVFRSTNGGIGWQSTSSGLPATVNSVAFSHSLRDIAYGYTNEVKTKLFAGTTDGLYVSTNAGTSWSRLQSFAAVGAVVSIAVHPNTQRVVSALTESGTVYRSLDWGMTFADITANIPAGTRRLLIDPLTPKRVYATGDFGISHLPHLWAGDIAVNATWDSGEPNYLGDIVVVPPDRTLNVLPGAEVESLRSNAGIYSFGNLNATGATFTRTGSWWYGIRADGGRIALTNTTISRASVGIMLAGSWPGRPRLAQSVIRNCQFTNNTVGIYLWGQELPDNRETALFERNRVIGCGTGIIRVSGYSGLGPRFEYNEVLNNTREGLSVANSRPVLYNNRFVGNGTGVACNSSGNAEFGRNDAVIPRTGSNMIMNNLGDFEIRVSNSSPFFGLADTLTCQRTAGGFNRVFNVNGNVGRVRADGGSYVLAHLTDWGWPVNRAWFETHGSASIDWRCAVEPPEESPEEKLKDALADRAQGDYASALSAYENVVQTHGMSHAASTAIRALVDTYSDFIGATGDSSLQSSFVAYLEENAENHPNVRIQHLARSLIADQHVKAGDYGTAIDVYEDLLAETLDEGTKVSVMASLAEAYMVGAGDAAAAEQVVTAMEIAFPGHPETELARITKALFAFETLTMPPPQSRSAKRPADTETLGANPLSFRLAQNSPNPFNPETQIHYELPSDEHVRLAVHDVLGREVAVLVNEFRIAGTYDVTFNAAGLSSGVYFYQLRAGSFTNVKKLLVLK